MSHFLPYARFVALLAVLQWAGCTTSRFYTPNTMQIPMLTGAGEGTVTGGITKDGNDTGWEAQAIYSPLPHLGLMVNHFDVRYEGLTFSESSFIFYETPFEGKMRMTEGGIGTYYQLGPEKEYLVSLFGGYGQGKTRNEYFPPPEVQSTEVFRSDWRFQRWFLQPAIGLKYPRFQVGTGLRFVWVGYYDGNINTRMGYYETERIQKLEQYSPLFLTEMAWTIGWRLKPVVISLNSTAVVRGNQNLRDLELSSNYVSLTVGLNLHEL